MEFAVCVMVIGVLMSVLLPRISEWRAEGRAIQVASAMASVNRAMLIFQAECTRAPLGQCDRLTINGQQITGVNGHPAATPDGIARLAELPAEVQLREHQVDGTPALTMRLSLPGIPLCEFTYVQAPRSGTAPAILRPTGTCP